MVSRINVTTSIALLTDKGICIVSNLFDHHKQCYEKCLCAYILTYWCFILGGGVGWVGTRVLKVAVLDQRVCAIAILIDTTRLHMAYVSFDKQEKAF